MVLNFDAELRGRATAVGHVLASAVMDGPRLPDRSRYAKWDDGLWACRHAARARRRRRARLAPRGP
jgi:hypothetical protein